MITITIYNLKDGAAKTTSAINMVHILVQV